MKTLRTFLLVCVATLLALLAGSAAFFWFALTSPGEIELAILAAELTVLVTYAVLTPLLLQVPVQ